MLTSVDGLDGVPGLAEMSDLEVDTAELSESGRLPLSNSRMLPDRRWVSSGRVNAESICVLYCASDENTAILECRAPVGSAVTVAVMQCESQLKIADLTEQKPDDSWSGFDGFKKYLKQCVAQQFSKRIVGRGAKYEYTLTQHISEQLKICGFDGIVYSSSQSETGVNYAFFEPDKFNFIEKKMYQIDKVSVFFSELKQTEKMSPSRRNQHI